MTALAMTPETRPALPAAVEVTALGLPQPAGRAAFAERILLYAAGLQVALLVPSLIAYALDDRLINDINVWTKPIKFQLSLAMLLVTLAWLLPLIPAAVRAGRTIRFTSMALAGFAVLEIIYITLQAARGRPSHFNQSTPVEAMGYSVMGVGAVTLVLGSALIGVMILRHGEDRHGQGLRLGAAWGLMLGGVLTLFTAALLSTGAVDGPGHWVGGIRSDLNGLPLVGWSTTGGDLRVPHFFATHLMQALPVLGLVADRLMPARVRPVILAGSLAGILIVALTLVQALAGMPFLG